jgi:hypothetical protein
VHLVESQSQKFNQKTYLLHIRVRTFAVFGDEAVDPRHDNGQWDRAELELSPRDPLNG